MIPGPLTSNAYVGFEVVNSPFDVRSYFIEGSPFRGIPLDAEEHTEFHVFISVSSPAFLCSRAVGFAVIDPLAFVHMDFGAAPFDLVRTAFFFGNPCCQLPQIDFDIYQCQVT